VVRACLGATRDALERLGPCAPADRASNALLRRSLKEIRTELQRNWMIYPLPMKRAPELEANLKCLQDCVQNDPVFKRDPKALAKLRAICCNPPRRTLQALGVSIEP
jgi:hypothetical protein